MKHQISIQAKHCLPLALSSEAEYMPIRRDLRQQMLSDLLSDLTLLTLSVWPLTHNVYWTPETSRPCAGRPGLWASILSQHTSMCSYVYCISVCVCECVPVWVHCDSKAYHLALPPEAWLSRARWRWLRCAFPPSPACTRDHVSLALCKQETCARSALSAATVLRVTLSSLHTQHDGHLNRTRREEEEE